jgi:hypothetical protein
MKRKTFQRALHTWPEWDDSIERSRKLLGYDPAWPKDTAINWIEKHYPEIRKQGEDEIRRLELPPTLRDYWEDCFYSNYKTKSGKTDFSKITRRLSDSKFLPELPCSHGVVWQESEDVNDPWLRVEIRLHGRFATRELFDYAARQAYDIVTISLGSMRLEEHPVCQWLKGGRPFIDEERALECARLKDEENWTEKDIGRKFGWALQQDNYGKLTQCRTARRNIRKGRELKKKLRDINPNTH